MQQTAKNLDRLLKRHPFRPKLLAILRRPSGRSIRGDSLRGCRLFRRAWRRLARRRQPARVTPAVWQNDTLPENTLFRVFPVLRFCRRRRRRFRKWRSLRNDVERRRHINRLGDRWFRNWRRYSHRRRQVCVQCLKRNDGECLTGEAEDIRLPGLCCPCGDRFQSLRAHRA